MLITAWPYWPRPPVWRTKRPWIFSTRFPIVSRYATWGRPTLASTLNSRIRRSTMISRCSSPIPEMSVCPVSSSVRTWNVGSSSASRWRPAPSLSWSPLVLGSMATEITGSGNVIDSSRIGAVSVARGPPRELVLGARVDPVDRRHLQRAREVVDHPVEQGLDALVLERAAAQHRGDADVERRLADRAAQHLGGHGALVRQVGLQQLVVVVGDRVDQLMVILVRLLGELGRNLLDLHR